MTAHEGYARCFGGPADGQWVPVDRRVFQAVKPDRNRHLSRIDLSLTLPSLEYETYYLRKWGYHDLDKCSFKDIGWPWCEHNVEFDCTWIGSAWVMRDDIGTQKQITDGLNLVRILCRLGTCGRMVPQDTHPQEG